MSDKQKRRREIFGDPEDKQCKSKAQGRHRKARRVRNASVGTLLAWSTSAVHANQATHRCVQIGIFQGLA